MKYVAALFFSIAIVLAAYILGNSYVKGTTPPEVINHHLKDT